MKKFYLKALSFAGILLTAFILLEYLSLNEHTRFFIAGLTNSTGYITGDIGTNEIIPVIQKVQQEDDTKMLILGDSVCRQLVRGLAEKNPKITIAPSNGAITMAGQYMLAKEYLNHHPNATDIFLILLPEALSRTFDNTLGYQYLVMPFAQTDSLKYLDSDTLDVLAETYGKPFLNPALVRLIDKSGLNRKLYYNYMQQHTDGYELSNPFELADQYILKINALCEENNVKFHLYPGPISLAKKEMVENLKTDFSHSKLSELAPNYLDQVSYYESEKSDDNIHFKQSYVTPEQMSKLMQEIYAGSELLDVLNF